MTGKGFFFQGLNLLKIKDLTPFNDPNTHNLHFGASFFLTFLSFYVSGEASVDFFLLSDAMTVNRKKESAQLLKNAA